MIIVHFEKWNKSIQLHYIEQKDVSLYARELCITPRYLSTITQSVLGESAKAIIDHQVILEIKALLDNTEATVQEIADHLNFPSQSYMVASSGGIRDNRPPPIDRGPLLDPETVSQRVGEKPPPLCGRGQCESLAG